MHLVTNLAVAQSQVALALQVGEVLRPELESMLDRDDILLFFVFDKFAIVPTDE